MKFPEISNFLSRLVSGLANTPASPETQNERLLLNCHRFGAEALSESKKYEFDRIMTNDKLRWSPRQMVVPLTYTCTDSRILPFTSFYVGVKVNAVGVKVKVAAQWLWGVKVNMGG